MITKESISVKLKERFCKDCNIPISIFQEPYFTDRLKLYDKHYQTVYKWNLFISEITKYNTEQDYFEEYNRVKDDAINTIKSSATYQKFNEEDMNKFAVVNKNLLSKDIYHQNNIGKSFISIDMKKANFSALKYYGDCIFDSMFLGKNTWEDFVGLFTSNKHIIESKYIRQVILGNCNPKRHITYEKYLMDWLLTKLLDQHINIDRVVFFSNDEIVIDVSDMDRFQRSALKTKIEDYLEKITIPFKVEMFKLNKINGTDGYCKFIYKDFENSFSDVKFKCMDSFYLPFVLRMFNGEEITESDKVFYHNGLLAKFIEDPKIEIITTSK